MTQYRLRVKKVKSGPDSRVEVPDDAMFVEVEYEKPVGMGKSRNVATIKYLEPTEK